MPTTPTVGNTCMRCHNYTPPLGDTHVCVMQTHANSRKLQRKQTNTHILDSSHSLWNVGPTGELAEKGAEHVFQGHHPVNYLQNLRHKGTFQEDTMPPALLPRRTQK